MKALLLAAALVLVGAPTALAQTQNATASATVNQVLVLNVTNLTVSFSTPTSTDFDAGYIASGTSSVISTKGNVGHTVTIASGTAAFTTSGGTTGADAPYAKPASELRWSTTGAVTGGTGGTGLSTTAATVTTKTRGNNANAATVNYGYALSYANDTPGTYSLGIVYTIAAN